MALPGSEIELKMKGYAKRRAAMEVGLLNPVFAEPPGPSAAGKVVRILTPWDFDITDDMLLAPANLPSIPAVPVPCPAKPLGEDGFNTDHAWDMVVLAAR